MSRLIAAIELSVNGISHGNSKSCLIASSRLRNIADVDPSGCEIGYFESFGSQNPLLRVGESKSTIISRAAAANTTNPGNIVIALTQKNADGTTSAITVNTEDILHVYFYPGDPTDSLLIMQDTTKTSTLVLRIDETKTAIQTAANG